MQCSPIHQLCEHELEHGSRVLDPVREVREGAPEVMCRRWLFSSDELVVDVEYSVEHPISIP